MLFWFIYLVSCFVVCYILSTLFISKFRISIFLFCLALLVTPENLGIGSERPSPAIFSFTFDLLFQQKLSLGTLRPLVFSVPFGLSVAFLIHRFKKRFFQG